MPCFILFIFFMGDPGPILYVWKSQVQNYIEFGADKSTFDDQLLQLDTVVWFLDQIFTFKTLEFCSFIMQS